ncbi:MAG: AtaL-like protein [Pseudohongiella sp.]|nr:DUF1857 family protein [Gammaproteobacteria bacterium]
MLEFEHIIQVNDLGNEAITVLTREQLWRGLALRAQEPDKFNQGLSCSYKSLSENEFLRTISTGESSFYERVVLTPEVKIHTETTGDSQQISAESTAEIEEPELNSLFVRFTYKRELGDNNSEINIGEHLKSAYVQIDQDAIAMIRVLAESNLFDQAIN